MHRFRNLVRFFKNYKLFSLAILAVIAGLILQFTGLHTAAHWVLGIVALYTLIPVIWGMWGDLQTGRYGIDILAVTAVVTSVILGQYWAGIVIVVMFTGGEALEDYAEHRAKTELDSLLSRVPQQAIVIRKGKTLTIPVRDIRVQDNLIFKPGEVVPVDAVIVEGTATFDESSLTGESVPQAKKPGDSLMSGSINLDGAITARCIRIAADSQYEQIIALVRAAASSQAPVVRLADRYSVPFTIISYVIAGTAWILSHQAIRFLEVIVVATPCPLLLAAPIAIISGMSRAAKHGIIIKTGSALERLANAKTVAFDKTGTLTQGILKVNATTAYAPFTKQQVLTFAASLEQNSNHVLAKAIVDKAMQEKLKIPKAKQVREVAGQGISSVVSGKRIVVGRLDFLESQAAEKPRQFKRSDLGATAVYVAIDGKVAGYLTLTDTIREESKDTIKRLSQLGIKDILMVTGDATATAKNIAKQLGIRVNNVHAEMLPADKLRTIESLTERPVVFVGDGVNDAPVLTASDVGIALGARGSTAASESADMVIMLDDVSRVARVMEIAKQTFRIARQSIIGGIVLSIFLMLIFASGSFPPLLGAILQEVVDVIVIFNALRAHGSWKRTSQNS